jgi:hypothetical protein
LKKKNLIERNLNILHFSLYKIETRLHFLFNKINPALLLYKVPFIKKQMKNKFGIDNALEFHNNFWTDKKNGFGLRFTGGWLIGIIALALIGVGKIGISFIQPEIGLSPYYFLAMGAISYVICYYLVFKEDHYLKYFAEFENWTKARKRLNALLSIGSIIFIITFFFISLLYFK